MKHVAIFGSTGSIGVNALSIVRHNPERFKVTCLTAQRNVDTLIKQALEFKPPIICIGDKSLTSVVRKSIGSTDTRILSGEEGLMEAAGTAEYDLMVGAIVGYAGFFPTLEAIKRRKTIALANKETLVVGGEIVIRMLKEFDVSLIPIDSEHSALFQCMIGEERKTIRRIILTASGGPFLHTPADEFDKITPDRALKHPNWSMGAKITVDSASLMNKGLEVIEAHWLFDVPAADIDVAIHPQSIVHSMVEFVDGSTKAQLGIPDMKVPIQYAMSFPDRIRNGFEPFDFRKVSRLDFSEPDTEKFPCLRLAYDALSARGTMPAVMNAANEIAVARFLKGEAKFNQIPIMIRHAMEKHVNMPNLTVENIVEADRWSRNILSEYKFN